MKNWVKHIIELIVITFSILVAFFVDNYREEIQQKKQGEEAIQLIIEELKRNKKTLDENVKTLQDFNEYGALIDSLNGDRTIDDIGFVELSIKDAQQLKRRFPTNDRLNVALKNDSVGTIRIQNTISIDFLLTDLDFSMWESSKFSGVLIGQNPKILSTIQLCYQGLMADFGSSVSDYHQSLIGSYSERETIDRIMDATYKLEKGYKLKLLLLDDRLEEAIRYIERNMD